ncbi:ALG9 [Candida theae]|uniref:Mannosyltransferase n=1 Tax=Candida theae TaxID=1198502 RepID=A0AAD5FY39_9ASCO|nr:ALG9 [Candida theae]KAI5957069.1 ALG9 [Candida theae]
MGLSTTQYGLILLNIAFRLYSSLYMIIGDCDETFNYWEPLNLLLRQFGKQTWEYSPVYSIRSYAYLIPYYIVGKVLQALNVTPINVFYGIRVVALGGFTSFVELNMFTNLNSYSANLANWWLFLSSINIGMSHGGIALLPSSLALQTTLLANAYIFKSLVSEKTSTRESNLLKAVTWYFIGGLLGWPFALALGLPVGVYTLGQVLQSRVVGTILFKIGLILVSIVAVITLIDSYYLQKLVFVPINIVLYNVFGGEGEGPEIFGVEPLSYYILNLLLNFQIVLPLAVLGALINPFVTTNAKRFSVVVSAQLIIWCGIFFSQPHKEERFMYPVYPLINLSAAIFVSKLTTLVKGRLPRSIYNVAQVGFVVAVLLIAVLRIANLVENYAAPLQVYEAVSQLPVAPSSNQINVCTGKEWYHFPNSFHIPHQHRLRFVESGFDGLLPGDFFEPTTSIIESTTFVPPHMNNKNQFESDKVIPWEQCDYFVDNTQAESIPQLIRPDLSVDETKWQILQCNKMINPNGKHNSIGKLIYIPQWARRLVPYNVEYMDLCLLKRVGEKGA